MVKRTFSAWVAWLALAASVVLMSCGSSPQPTVAPRPSPTSSPSPQPTLAPTPTPETVQGRTRHLEPQGGFSYIPPKGWDLIENSALPYKMAIGPKENDFSPNISIIDDAFDGSLEAYVQSSLENMSGYFEGFVLINQEPFKPTEATDGVKLVVQNSQGGRNLRQIFYIFDGGTSKTIMTCSQLAEGGMFLDIICDRTAHTFRWEPY